ncbi:uncharacterized protein LOC121856407 [Homarus americanus]|uniref:uncharacterized protein LOC121856407 n=1 Tax=Homarus americanus TaxID=6706 RepID=UPI001C43EE51|nr:uncharacterized protein LOC121856407 [Homarus americanus]
MRALVTVAAVLCYGGLLASCLPASPSTHTRQRTGPDYSFTISSNPSVAHIPPPGINLTPSTASEAPVAEVTVEPLSTVDSVAPVVTSLPVVKSESSPTPVVAEELTTVPEEDLNDTPRLDGVFQELPSTFSMPFLAGDFPQFGDDGHYSFSTWFGDAPPA